MTTKLIKCDGYWIVISDEEIKNHRIFAIYTNNNFVALAKGELHDKECYPVIYSQNPEHNLPTITFSDEVAKELGIIDVEKLANKWFDIEGYEKTGYIISHTRNSSYTTPLNLFTSVYNQCLSDNIDKKFTLEDMINLIAYIANFEDDNDCNIASSGRMPSEIAKTYIQSLAKEEFFCELEKDNEKPSCGIKDRSFCTQPICDCISIEPKITNNSVTVKKIWK